MKKILLVEDDQNLNKGIQLCLSKEGYQVVGCLTIAEAKKIFAEHKFDLIICDITLPDGNGLEFCQTVRQKSNVLILILTSHKEEYEIVAGYESGADDYMTKPFSLMVLVSKINALAKRIQVEQAQVLISGNLQLDLSKMKALMDNVELPLSKTEIQLLAMFMKNPKQILSQEQLLEQVWDTKGTFLDDNTVFVNISRLRQKIGKEKVKTIRGVGYLWVNDVHSL